MSSLRPEDEAALVAAIRGANGPLSVRGGGTRSGPVPDGAQTLETGALAGVRLYEPGALTLVAGAGTPLAEIETLLASENQRLAFEPPDMRGLLGTRGTSTIGGEVADNASGPRRANAGAARDFLLGVRYVDGQGRLIKNGGRVMKNVTGLDLARLMAGSRGSLGVLSEVALKVLPAPETSVTLALHGADETDAIGMLCDAMTTPWDVSGAAFHRGAGGSDTLTLLRVEGFAGQVAYRSQKLRDRLAAQGDFQPLECAADERGGWQWVGDVAPFHGAVGDVWQVSLRPSQSAAIVARARALDALYDWGGARVWLLTEPGSDLRARLGPFEGHARLVRANAGTAQAEPPLSPTVARLEAGLRAKFDPRGLFAPTS